MKRKERRNNAKMIHGQFNGNKINCTNETLEMESNQRKTFKQ